MIRVQHDPCVDLIGQLLPYIINTSSLVYIQYLDSNARLRGQASQVLTQSDSSSKSGLRSQKRVITPLGLNSLPSWAKNTWNQCQTEVHARWSYKKEGLRAIAAWGFPGDTWRHGCHFFRRRTQEKGVDVGVDSLFTAVSSA